MSDRWDDLRFNAAEGEWVARPLGDMRRCLADLLAERDALAAEVERLRAKITAERMYAAFWKVGGKWSWNDAVRLAAALTEGDDRG